MCEWQKAAKLSAELLQEQNLCGTVGIGCSQQRLPVKSFIVAAIRWLPSGTNSVQTDFSWDLATLTNVAVFVIPNYCSRSLIWITSQNVTFKKYIHTSTRFWIRMAFLMSKDGFFSSSSFTLLCFWLVFTRLCGRKSFAGFLSRWKKRFWNKEVRW